MNEAVGQDVRPCQVSTRNRAEVLGRVCRSPKRHETRERSKAGDDGRYCSPFLRERPWFGAGGPGGPTGATRARWKRSRRRSWHAVTRSPAEIWNICCRGRPIGPVVSPTFWALASWHEAGTKPPPKPGRGSRQVLPFQKRRSAGGCGCCWKAGGLPPPNDSSSTPPTAPVAIERPC